MQGTKHIHHTHTHTRTHTHTNTHRHTHTHTLTHAKTIHLYEKWLNGQWQHAAGADAKQTINLIAGERNLPTEGATEAADETWWTNDRPTAAPRGATDRHRTAGKGRTPFSRPYRRT